MSSQSKQKKSNQTNVQYDDWYNGSIMSITLENFMCHSNFHLTLNPRINFISGLNGSGKSAIQAALVIGFGSRASITNRGTSLKTFIKYGCSSSTVSITIANGGKGKPYSPEIYGKQITIVRQITESGHIPYKFLNENGRVVKCSKNELKNMLLHFNILVENPVCIMNQSMVKMFHKNANSQGKYNLFYRCISADVFADNIEETKLVSKNYLNKLVNMKSVIDQCNKEVIEYKLYYDKSKQLDEIKINKLELENEYAWCVITEQEKKYEEVLHQIELHENSLSRETENTKTLTEKIQTCSEMLIKKKEELTNVEESYSHNHLIFMETKQKLRDLQNELDLNKQIARKYNNTLDLLLEDKKQIVNTFEEQREKNSNNTLALYKEELSRYEQNIIEVDAGLKTHREHEKTLHNTVEDLKLKLGHLMNKEVTPLQRKIDEINRNINNMSNQQNTLNLYGNWMPQLLLAIENAFKQKRFIKKPLGPIGSYIKVNEDKWIFSIENHLGRSTLRTFLVDNFTDNKVLTSIMDTIVPGNRKPTIITSKFFNRIHNINAKDTKNSMFSMLTFTDPVVANALIDNNRIEKIMLVEDKQEAMTLMENASRVPMNCIFSLTLDGTQVYPSPSYRLYSLQHSVQAVLLQSDMSIAVNNLKHQKQELKEKLNNLNNEYKNIEKENLEKQKHLKKTEIETKYLKNKYDEYTKHISELRSKCEEEQDDRLSTLEQEIIDINLKIEEATKIKENAMKPILICEREIKEINEKLVSIKFIIEKSDRSVIIEEIDSLKTQIDKYKTGISKFNVYLFEHKKALKDLTLKAEGMNKNLKQDKKNAELLGDKVEMVRSSYDIWKNIEKVLNTQDFLERELKKKGNHLLLRDEYIKKKQNYFNQNALFKQIQEIYRSNANAIELSRNALQLYLQSTALYVVDAFNMLLSLRNVHGSLMIDNNEKTLDITMFDNISTSCASGGERTFATVAMILALWSSMQLPFYSIDEYDVYMDNVNRLATTKLLLMTIKKRYNQFIFLTPHDISDIKSAHNIKIVKLKEPRSE